MLEQESTEAPFSIEPYLRANRLGTWTYLRTPAGRPDAAGVTYVRTSQPHRMLEGLLAERSFLPLQYYLQQPGTPADPRQRPRAPLQGGTAFLFELGEPLEPLPADLQPGVPQTASTALVYYEYDGRILNQGTLTRTAAVEGFEDIETPAGRFEACLRVRVDLTVEISWVFKMDWTTQMWLSPTMGEVRRLERMSGAFLIILFSSGHEYRLVSGQPRLDQADSVAVRPPLWKRSAVLLERAVPRPRIGGLVVDYSDGTPAAAPIEEEPPIVTDVPATAPASAAQAALEAPGEVASSIGSQVR